MSTRILLPDAIVSCTRLLRASPAGTPSSSEFLDPLVGSEPVGRVGAAELPGELAPQGADPGAPVLGVGLAGGEPGAHQGDASDVEVAKGVCLVGELRIGQCLVDQVLYALGQAARRRP